jgi:hypothetical protein
MLLDIGAERVSALPTNPLPTTPRDFMETLALSYEADRSTTASDSRTRNNLAEYDRAADELRSYGGAWTNPVMAPPENDPNTGEPIPDRQNHREQWQQRIEQLMRERPQEAERLARFMPDEIERRAGEGAATRSREYDTLAEVQGASVAGTLGGLAAAIRDPLNIATMPLGAGRVAGGVALRIAKTALVEGVVGAGTQLAVDAYAAPYRVEIGLPADVGGNVLMGFLGGAIIGGGIRGTVEGVRYLRGSSPAPDGAQALREADSLTVLDTLRREEAGNPAGPAQAEMHLAALDRATAAVASGRIAEDASLIIPPSARAAEEAGGMMRVFTPTGRAVEVQPQVMELADLIPSHTDDFALNPAYPHSEGVQPRDRSRDASISQVQQIAGNLEPDRLQPSPEAGQGAPIVDGENVVESGNGRVLALRQVYGNPANAERAAAYRAMLAAQGHDVTGFAAPVLVSRRVTALAPDERRAFVREANAETALGLGAAEQARVDAEQIGRIIDLYQGGDITSADNIPFVRGFMRGLPQTAQGRMVSADGVLSGEGARRIRSAVLARAYGDQMGTLLERITEGEAEGLKSIAGALQDVAGRWAMMREAARGSAPPPPAPGMVRLYHGSATHRRYTGPAWFSSSKEYARNYRGLNAELQYVDVPAKWADQKQDPDGYGQGVTDGYTLNVEIKGDEFGPRRPYIETPPSIAPAMDSTADLFAAVNTVSLARQKRIPVADILAQADLDAPPLSDAGRAMLATMFRDPQFRGAAGRETIAARLNGYVDEAMKTQAEPDMFGTPPPTAAQVMEATDPMRGRQAAAAQAGDRMAALAENPKLPEAEVAEAQRIAAAQDVLVPDAEGNMRSLRDQLDEADNALADAAGAAACFIGAATP